MNTFHPNEMMIARNGWKYTFSGSTQETLMYPAAQHPFMMGRVWLQGWVLFSGVKLKQTNSTNRLMFSGGDFISILIEGSSFVI